MFKSVIKWGRRYYERILNSIAFYPAVIAIAFLLVSWLMLRLDISETGKNIKAYHSWIRLKDANTARSVVSTIAGGIISLTVFSFSMVMIVLNQAASQMTNRMLESMISNRFQQIVLGIYIGTIVYALFLLSSIRDVDSGIYVPVLSIYFLLVLMVLAIFLFIYFLHYVTQSAKFETIIERVHKKTLQHLIIGGTQSVENVFDIPLEEEQVIHTLCSGYYQSFDKRKLIKFAFSHRGTISIMHCKGTFLLKGTPFIKFYSNTKLTEKDITYLFDLLDFYNGQPIDETPYYGFHQLAEVAIKALSPGINDPETAVLSIHALSDLFLYKLHNYINSILKDDEQTVRIHTKEWGFEDLFEECIYPIWDYGKQDRYIQKACKEMTERLLQEAGKGHHASFIFTFLAIIQRQISSQ